MQQIVVDAPDEGEARQQVAKRAPRGPAPRQSAPNPWLDPALTSFEKVDENVPAGTGAQGRMREFSHTRGG
jgi:hypothetical protein